MSVDAAVLPGIAAVVISDWRSAAHIIDHTLLAPEATRAQLVSHCGDAEKFGFHCVVVNPCYVASAAAQLRGTPVKVAAVVGFPLGANLTATKLAEAEAALHNGARELEMVINIGALKSGDRVLVQTEMRLLAKLAHEGNALLKIILENALLTQEEKILGCALAMDAGADFVKTLHRFRQFGRDRSRCRSYAWRGRPCAGRQSRGRHSHRRPPPDHGRCRSQPHRHERGGQHRA